MLRKMVKTTIWTGVFAVVSALAPAWAGTLASDAIFGLGTGLMSPAEQSAAHDLGITYRRVSFEINYSWTQLATINMASLENAGAFVQMDTLMQNVAVDANLIPYMVANVTKSPKGAFPTAEKFAAVLGVFADRYCNGTGNGAPELTQAPMMWEILNQITPGTGAYVGFTPQMYKDYLQQSKSKLVSVTEGPVQLMNGAQVGAPYDGTPLNQLLKVSGAEATFDGLSYNATWPYGPFDPQGDASLRTPDYLEMQDFNSSVDILMTGTKPVYVTQADWQFRYGWANYFASYGELEKAPLHMTKSYLWALANGADMLMHPKLMADGTSAAADWVALVDSDGKARPQYFALQQMIEKLDGLDEGSIVQAKSLQTSNGDTAIVLEYTVDGKIFYAAWDYAFDVVNSKLNTAGTAYVLYNNYQELTSDARSTNLTFALEVTDGITQVLITSAIPSGMLAPTGGTGNAEPIFDSYLINVIDGVAMIPIGETPVFIELIPEPATMLLMFGGLGLALRRRRS